MKLRSLVRFLVVSSVSIGVAGLSVPSSAQEATENGSLPATGDRAAPAVAGESGRQQPPALAASPGRQESPPPAAPVTSAASRAAGERRDSLTHVFECPREQVARMLETAVEAADDSASMGMEMEILRLCRDRWKVVKDIVDAEAKLAAILRTDRLTREKAALELEERRRIARARIEGARQGAVEAAKAVEERRLVKDEPPPESTEDKKEVQPATPVVVVQKPKTHEVYGWFTIVGSGSDLRAGVSDGNGRWWVRVGDALPDGGRVTEISARPPAVRVAGGPPSGLPYRGLR